MRSKQIEKLVGEYLTVRMTDHDTETVRCLAIKPPTDREIAYGHVSNRVHIRRFLLGGWVDTWVLPRDVLAAAHPSKSVLAMIEYVEKNVGAKPKRRAVA